MNRLAWIAVGAVVALMAFVVGDLLDADSVPVAQAVELTGDAPADRPLPEGFFIVPPRVVDFRGNPVDDEDSSDSPESPAETGDVGVGSERPVDDDPVVAPDDSSDDGPDDSADDADDSVDDDD